MKKINCILCILFLGILLSAKPADAKVNEEAFNEFRKVYNGDTYKTLYDTDGNVYLQRLIDNEDEALIIVSTPDAKNGKTILVIPDTVKINGKIHRIAGVGADDHYDVGTEVFSIGTGYKKIIFGRNVYLIERYTFERYDSLEEIEFLEGPVAVAEDAFFGCKNLKKIIGSEKIQDIGKSAFWGTAITHFEVSDKCRAIREEAFAHCEKLKEMPNVFNAKELEGYIFSHCYGLKKVVIPDGVKKIPAYMFSNCVNLTEVYIPKSVKKMGGHVFWGSKKLRGNVTIDPKNKYFSAKDNMILNKKEDTLLSMISPVKVMVIPSYVKKVKSYWAQDYIYSEGPYGENPKFLLKTIIVQNKDINFLKKSVPCWYSPGYCKQKINILYPGTRRAFAFTGKQINQRFDEKVKLKKSYKQRAYTLYAAPTKVKAKLKKGRVQVSFKKLKNIAVKKYKITYRIKKNGTYKTQKEKVIMGNRASLCSLKKGETCEVRVSAYTKQSSVWVPGKFSRMVKVRKK